MAFGQQVGTPASARQLKELSALLQDLGYASFREARGPMRLTQRQAGGRFTNDEATWEKFLGATKISGEKFWRLPCTDDYKDQIKSQIADMMNTGKNRWGGAISAAMFLKEFVGETPWLHLDIAGCAWNDENKPWIANGPSGIAVRSILEWVRSYSA